MPENEEPYLVQRIRTLIETHDIADALTEPLESSMRALLEISAAQLDSDEGSILVREHDTGDLTFLMATGKVADQLTGMTVPAGKGIAGFVLMSGQPMAASDAEGEETFYAEVDRATGYSTQSIVAVPIRFKDEVIGVLEYVNRRGEPPFAPFTPEEMDKAAVYADAFGALINAYEGRRILAGLARRSLSSPDADDLVAIQSWISSVRGSDIHREQIELAVMVRELASRGDAERSLCRELIASVLKFRRATGDLGRYVG